jgi:hypothetical protein
MRRRYHCVTLCALLVLCTLGGVAAPQRAFMQEAATATPTRIITPSSTATPTTTATPAPTQTPYVIVQSPTPQLATATQPTGTPQPGERPDRCEANDERKAACNIGVDSVSGPFSFYPVGDQDWYRVDLGAPSGLETTITVRTAGALDLLASISLDDGTPLTTISSPAISTTLRADLGGGVILHVENRSPADAADATYNIEVRRTLPPPPPPPHGVPTLGPDPLENNWNVETAAPIGVGVIYDLNFVCPVPWGCGGGDHDYLRLPVKAGVRYLITTFDLGPGVDTAIDLYWQDESHYITTNDDERPGSSFLSTIRWVSPGNGDAIIRVAPRTGGVTPLVLDEKASTYRFAVALAGSPLAQELEARIAEQTNRPQTPPPPAGSGGGGQGGGGSSGGNTPPTPAPAPTALPSPTTMPDTSPEAVDGATVEELSVEDVSAPTPLPLLTVPVALRVCYDRNANTTCDVDEGIAGLTVYVSDAQTGGLLGQALTDASGVAAIAARVLADAQLTVTVPYFAAARTVSARAPRPQPIVVSTIAPIPALLP